MTDTLSIKEWADKRTTEIIKDIHFFMSQGISKRKAYNMAVVKGSCLGAGYRAQIRKEICLGMKEITNEQQNQQ